jgi:lipoprotein-anchoring transpeptidase ErfK/SrfK
MIHVKLLLLFLAAQEPPIADAIDGITFAGKPGTLYVPIREVCNVLEMPLGFREDGRLQVAGKPLDEEGKKLPTGTRLIAVRDLARWDTEVRWDPSTQTAILSRNGKESAIRRGEKRVVVDKSTQTLSLFQGEREVMETKISTGRMAGSTPNGEFKARLKKRMHYSTLYDNAPMPYSVQVVGNIFIHGYHQVPDRPASHGCIRVPLQGQAQFFFDWVEVGTPVTIEGRWAAS